MRQYKTILIFFLILSCWSPLSAKEQEVYKPHGFLDFNTYYDTRNFETHTLNARLDLPGPFSYFGFTNWTGNQTGDNWFDYGDHYTEQSLYYDQIFSTPFDLTIQYADLSGPNNDVMRTGIQAHVHKFKFLEKLFKAIHASYKLTYFPWQLDHFDDYAFQLQHVWYMNILPKVFKNRLYMFGFADHNFLIGSTDAHNKLVTETQFGYRLWKGLHAITELRWNGYLPKPYRFGVGMGFQYKYSF